MRNVLRFTLMYFALLAGTGSVAHAAGELVCLSNLCIGKSGATEMAVVKRLGPGIEVHRPDDVGKSRCYFDSVRNVWADFTFAGEEEARKGSLQGLMLTEQKICDNRSGSKVKLGRQLAGASIGMSESEVLVAMGTPTRIDDSRAREAKKPSMANTRYSAKFGELVYVYEKLDDLGFTFVFFKDGHVRTIWFSSSE